MPQLLLVCVLAVFSVLQDKPLPGNWDPTNPEDVARRASDPAGGDASGDPLKGPNVPKQNQGSGRRGDGAMVVTVESILQAKCASCHGPDKQKGGLQILPVQRLHEGPEKFRVVVPGDAAGSLLVQRMKLPANHDDVMPPDGKVLSAQETAAIEAWINAGATEGQAKRPIESMSSRGAKSSARAFLRAYMALKDLTAEQRSAGIKAAEAARKGLSDEDKKFWADFQKLRKAQQDGGAIPADLVARRQEIQSKLQDLQNRAAALQAQLWNGLTTEQQKTLRAALEQGTKGQQRRGQRGGQSGGQKPGSGG